MDRLLILKEIQRTAAQNGGVPLGRDAFFAATRIKQTDWYGKHWVRWGDALVEAGFSPNQFQEAHGDEAILEKVATFIEELGHFPVVGELRMRAKSVNGFPSHSTIGRLGSKAELATRLVEYAGRTGKPTVAQLAGPVAALGVKQQRGKDQLESFRGEPAGYVYLIKHGNRSEYKIGKTNNPLRREGELRLQLPERLEPLHYIETDDPAGIETYWHTRFASKRKEGEWFALAPADVQAFKRWKRIF